MRTLCRVWTQLLGPRTAIGGSPRTTQSCPSVFEHTDIRLRALLRGWRRPRRQLLPGRVATDSDLGCESEPDKA